MPAAQQRPHPVTERTRRFLPPCPQPLKSTPDFELAKLGIISICPSSLHSSTGKHLVLLPYRTHHHPHCFSLYLWYVNGLVFSGRPCGPAPHAPPRRGHGAGVSLAHPRLLPPRPGSASFTDRPTPSRRVAVTAPGLPPSRLPGPPARLGSLLSRLRDHPGARATLARGLRGYDWSRLGPLHRITSPRRHVPSSPRLPLISSTSPPHGLR